MSFGKQPQSQLHLIVLALCVAACLAIAFWPQPSGSADPAGPEGDAAVLVKGVMGRALSKTQPEPRAE